MPCPPLSKTTTSICDCNECGDNFRWCWWMARWPNRSPSIEISPVVYKRRHSFISAFSTERVHATVCSDTIINLHYAQKIEWQSRQQKKKSLLHESLRRVLQDSQEWRLLYCKKTKLNETKSSCSTPKESLECEIWLWRRARHTNPRLARGAKK